MVNTYKIYCNVIYTPMARSLSDYFMNQFFNIYYFIFENDFNHNYAYFFISEILCILTNFFCCIYNEYVILFLCGLEHDTKEKIIERSLSIENNSISVIELDNNTIDNDISYNNYTDENISVDNSEPYI